ncbi:DUF1513 domain-containing protein [Aquibium sp. ELW1220]|uniref:DUF1513 domain-containing protein n=1 Tax=Aquibium sp. ELW1220 TaxID=2976766 RepID=UPI0025B08EEA|nr:DUF1513 domain-containing protein [Aquibium sp. ELW1220]MDN2579600.1 DUF1513 domain-containing protein [Aquibium sp. ELW1220]
MRRARTGSLVDRRIFLQAAGGAFLAGLSPGAATAMLAADAVFATAYVDGQGRYGIALLSEGGRLVCTLPLPGRGHDIAFDPLSRRAVAFARRPGTFALVFDRIGRAAPVTVAAAPGRHFFGHGVFSPDGKLLYATENDIDAAAGLIGVYDATGGFDRIGEFPTHGMDPHELLLMPDGRTLAVANGGIETHPDFGRAKLNLATMKPSLVFLDRHTGSLVESHELSPDLHQLSIRHMDLDADGRVWFGCQYEGPALDRPPLVGSVRPGETVALLDMAPDILSGFRNYIGSVAANPAAGTVAVSSPQGNRLAVIDAKTGRIVADRALAEVCGIAADRDGYIATTGEGRIVCASGKDATLPDHVWDNHILRIG